nr:hypothetical protein [Paenibacillus xylanexedens]
MKEFGDDYLATELEYNGELHVRECAHCYRELIHGEKLYKTEENGRVCLECRDVIREFEAEWGGL